MPQTMQHHLPESLVLVIFGGSGDLTKRKLIPSLYQLFKQDKLPIRFSVLGLGRTEYSDVAYREHLDEALQRYLSDGEYDASLAEQFLSGVYYLPMDPASAEDYPKLREQLKTLDERINNPKHYIYYLSTPPSLYGVIHSTWLLLGSTKRARRILMVSPLRSDVSSSRSPSAMISSQQES